MLLNIAIVEDTPAEAERLISFLERFAKETGEPLRHFLFDNAVQFLDGYKSQYDIVFMDIELPDLNGMDAARRLRLLDDSVVLIFVTHLSQYAVKGYEVDALDYILKPLNYPALALKLQRAVARRRRGGEAEITLSTNSGLVRLMASSLKYVEIYNHHIVYHTESDDYTTYGTLKQIEDSLPKQEFYRCSSSYIVNLRHVTKIDGLTAIVDGKPLPISRMRKKEFLAELHSYCSRRMPGGKRGGGL